MPNIDDYPETPKNPGSYERMLERQRLRLERKMNVRYSAPRGISEYVLRMRKKEAHLLDCKCPQCIPPWLKEWLNSRKKAKPRKKKT